jgi:ubiquinone/menaquinone biosynthesis C-methylase UbiE
LRAQKPPSASRKTFTEDGVSQKAGVLPGGKPLAYKAGYAADLPVNVSMKMSHSPNHLPPGAGKSSFDLIDSKTLFKELGLKKGMTLLDMACGRGIYALAASEQVGEEGVVYALDLWEEGVDALRMEASAKGISNIRAKVADLKRKIPLDNSSVDVCLLATALHDLVQSKAAEAALREAARVLKPEGSLTIVEFKKIDGPPGPPIHIRLSPDQVGMIVIPFGFEKKRVLDVGPYTYLMTFLLRKTV